MGVNGRAAAETLRTWGPLAHHGACLYYVWLAYKAHGARATGSYRTATLAWNASPGKHRGDRNPPAGVPVWWGPRPGNDAGDVVISLGGGKVVATDYPRYGVVGVCTIDQRERQIGRPYLGWTETILGAKIDYSTNGQPAGSIKEEDMPLNASDKKWISAEIEKVSRRVWTEESAVNGAKFGDMLRVTYDSVRFGKKGVRTHGDLTAAIMAEIGAQKIFRAKNGGDPVDVEELAETLAPLLSDAEAKEFAAAVVKRMGTALTGSEDQE